MMRFKPEVASVSLPGETLEQDFAHAKNMGKLHLGEHCLFFRKFSGSSYLPYGQVLRAWLRQEEVKARMCCATANFDQFFVVMECADGQQRRGQVIDKDTGKAALEHIAAKNPDVKIGYIKAAEEPQ